jgi:hypothetical protein
LPILDEHEHLVGLLSLADVARERRRSPGLATDEDIAATLGGIDQPRGARTLMTAASSGRADCEPPANVRWQGPA